MKTLRLYSICAVLVALSLAAAFFVQSGLDGERSGRDDVEGLMYLPDAGYIKVASLGYDQLAADLIWLKAIQTLGDMHMSSEECDWSYRALDTLTEVDPYFVEAYEMGGLILTLNEDKVDLADRLLEKGVRYNPGVWQLEYYLGFNYYYFKGDYERAYKALTRAAEIEGSPWFLPYLASRVSASAGKPEFALEFLKRMYDQVDDERLRKRYLKRINELESVVMMKAVQKTVDGYSQRTGRMPGSLAELVRAGALRAVPEDPAGGKFYLDDKGVVRSTAVEEGVGVFETPSQRKKK